MAKFKLVRKVAKLDEVAEPYRGAYVEKDGAFHLDPEKLEAIEFDGKEELSGALERERKDRKAAKEALAKYEGIDPERARAAQKRLDELDDKQLIDKNEFDRLLDKRTKEFEARETEYQTKLEAATGQLTKFKLTDKVRAAALAAGVLADDIDDVLTLTSPRFRLGDKDQIIVLDKDGDESSLTLDKYFGEDFKNAKPKFYGASGAGGSGAPAGGTGGGSGGAKTVNRADFEKMEPSQQMSHFKDGGKVVD